MELTAIVIMSIIIEAVISYVKTWAVDKKIKWQCIAALALSVAVCIAYKIDIPAAVGVNAGIPYIGSVLSGILVSRGSNYIYDLLKKLTGKGIEAQIEEIVGADASEGVEI